MCVCVCVREREREREWRVTERVEDFVNGWKEKKNEIGKKKLNSKIKQSWKNHKE